MKTQLRIIIAVLIITGIAGYVLYQKNLPRKTSTVAESGEEIARRQCGYCHQFPSPELLDKKTWETQVLPEMGRRLGITTPDYDPFDNMQPEEASIVSGLNIYPDDTLISKQEWQRIVDFYVDEAPETLHKSTQMTIVSEQAAPFQPHFIEIEGEEIPQVTLLHYDTISNELYIGANKKLYALNSQGEFSARWGLTSPAVDIEKTVNGRRYLLTIGRFRPSDVDLGAFSMTTSEASDDFHTVITNLPRPVSFTLADLDEDGNEDMIVCGFGHHEGELAWYRNLKEKHILNNQPGTRIAIVQDVNGDGRSDIVALMAQAWEGIDIYYNQGSGSFTRDRVLEFSPVHGLSYLELADFNDDGYQDLLVTNGDNWDYSMTMKPYHGLRIYLNDGNNQFQEAFFYPMNGCSKAISEDFDRDGDLDIAAISFYDHIDQPEKSFVYLENTGDMLYVAHYLPEAANGKWLTLEAGDFDQDGYMDLFLGSYFHNIGEWTKLVNKGTTTFPEVLYLLNTTMLVETKI